MFEPRFVEHRGVRILRLEFSHLSGAELVAAADQVRGIVAAEPLRSVRALTILSSWLTEERSDALKRCALANRPYVRAGAVVAPTFWRVVATDLQAHGREDLRFFTDEASALEWLSGT
ncbi:MAG TPA: hypothetical protein VF400_10470 [Anaeromyxobacteraceae bacterium]